MISKRSLWLIGLCVCALTTIYAQQPQPAPEQADGAATVLRRLLDRANARTTSPSAAAAQPSAAAAPSPAAHVQQKLGCAPIAAGTPAVATSSMILIGTHGSASYSVSGAGADWARDQSASITGQCGAGVRVFDIRVSGNGDITHGMSTGYTMNTMWMELAQCRVSICPQPLIVRIKSDGDSSNAYNDAGGSPVFNTALAQTVVDIDGSTKTIRQLLKPVISGQTLLSQMNADDIGNKIILYSDEWNGNSVAALSGYLHTQLFTTVETWRSNPSGAGEDIEAALNPGKYLNRAVAQLSACSYGIDDKRFTPALWLDYTGVMPIITYDPTAWAGYTGGSNALRTCMAGSSRGEKAQVVVVNNMDGSKRDQVQSFFAAARGCTLGACIDYPAAGYAAMCCQGYCPNFSTQTGYDFPGNDIRSFSTSSVDLCQRACDSEAACVGIVHHDNTCWLKSQISGATQKASAGVTVGRCGGIAIGHCTNFQTVTGFDFYNSDIRSMAAASIDECYKNCDIEPSCGGVVYHDGTCWLKTSAAFNGKNEHVRAGSVAGKCGGGIGSGHCTNFKYISGYDYPNVGDISSASAASIDECYQMCDFEPTCGGVVYRDYGTCYLKTSAAFVDANRKTQSGALVGKCGGDIGFCQTSTTTTGVDYPGSDIRSFSTSVLDECYRACNSEPTCGGYVWHDNTCWLKTSQAFVSTNKVTRDGSTVGVCTTA